MGAWFFITNHTTNLAKIITCHSKPYDVMTSYKANYMPKVIDTLKKA